MSKMPKVSEICWNELATPNVKAAKEFYSKVFGWKFIDNNIDDMTYTMVKTNENEKEFAGIWAIPQDKVNEIPPHWMTYILVENLEEALKKATSSGANIMKPVTHVSDYGKFAIITDPTGANIALWQNLKNC